MKLIIDIPDKVYNGAQLLGDVNGVIQLPLEVISKGLPFNDFANRLKDDIYKFQRDSLNPEYAECYRIVLLSVISNCQEVQREVEG